MKILFINFINLVKNLLFYIIKFQNKFLLLNFYFLKYNHLSYTYINYAHSIRCRHTVILIHTSSKYSYSTCGTNIFACYRHKVHNTVQNMWYYYGTELGNKSTVWYRHSVQKYAEQMQTQLRIHSAQTYGPYS